MEMTWRPCVAAKRSSWGRRAIGAVVVHDLGEHPGRVAAGEAARSTDASGVPGPLEDAAVAVAQREDVAGAGQVLGVGRRVEDGAHAVVAPVGGRDAGAGCPVAGATGHGERGPVCDSVLVGHHERQGELVETRPSTGMQITPLVWRIIERIVSGLSARRP